MKPVIAIPAIAALVYRAWSRKSLTPLGIVVAFITAVVHALHPWSAPFALLVVFFLGGTATTKVKHNIKASLTLSSTGSAGGEGARTEVQVLANSVVASTLILLQVFSPNTDLKCLPLGGTSLVLTAGIVAQYAAVAADTYSSELGILSKSKPRLITNLRTVPPGTNGGVTAAGLLAGAFGAFTIAVTSALLIPFCPGSPGPVGRVLMTNESRGWGLTDKLLWVVVVTIWGTLGSVLDSLLGALLQASVVDKRTGKVVEGAGGTKVMTHPTNPEAQTDPSLKRRTPEKVSASTSDENRESRTIVSGHDWLDNNQINLLMASTMSVWAMVLVELFVT